MSQTKISKGCMAALRRNEKTIIPYKKRIETLDRHIRNYTEERAMLQQQVDRIMDLSRSLAGGEDPDRILHPENYMEDPADMYIGASEDMPLDNEVPSENQ